MEMSRITHSLKKSIVLMFTLPLYLSAFLFSRGAIRLGYIPTQTISRISLMLKDVSIADKESLKYSIWFNDKYISNKVIANAIKQYVRVWPSSIVKPLYDLLWRFGLYNRIINDKQVNKSDEKTSSFSLHKILSSSEIEYCQKQLRSHLKDSQRQVAVLCVRDDLYDSLFRSNSIALELSHRNSDVEIFQGVVELLISENYNVVRIGRHVRKRATFQSEFYWDYATSNIQNDMLDIYLFGVAKLCVSTRYGVDDLATLFGVPLFLFDHAEDLFCQDAFFVHPKLFFSAKDHILKIDQIESLEISKFRSALDFEKSGVFFRSNESKTLKNAMIEGLSFLKTGEFNSTHISSEWKRLVNEI